ncbi:MAG: 3-dehydroquinate synthase [Balneolaceae bacterium]
MKANVRVESSAETYSVSIGHSILKNEIEAFFDDSSVKECFVLVDENVEKLHGNRLKEIFDGAGIDFTSFVIPEGEKSKSIEQWSRTLDFLLQNGVRRNTPLISIGGGITGDLAGFVAASVLRGIPLLQVPTTVLAMVDSSVGGKTGINHQTGKNLIGAFYQPQKVIADIEFLETLPRKEWISGLSEILKYGAISDSEILEKATLFFEEDVDQIDKNLLIQLIKDCVSVKADIVKKDEFEGGVRAFLNFGHTFAHALEKAANFDEISHGEAVFLGMLAAIDLSNSMGFSIDSEPIRQFRSLYEFSINAETLDTDTLIQYMKSDKKIIDSEIRFILLENWQHPVIKTVNDQELISKACLSIIHEL